MDEVLYILLKINIPLSLIMQNHTHRSVYVRGERVKLSLCFF